MTKTDELKKAIDELKVIIENYQMKEDKSQLLYERLENETLKKMLNEFYELMNRPVVKKKAPKRQPNKSMNEKPPTT